MNIKEIGEFGFIRMVGERFKDLVPSGVKGIGDDCAVIPLGGGRSLLVTADMLVGGSHFLMDDITPYQLGWKSLAVNLSDIAAMGGRPVGTFLSIALRKETDLEWVGRFLDGYRDLSETHGVPLLGGDTTEATGEVTINVTVVGMCDDNRVKLRSGAQPGDRVAVTGTLGDSAAGLKLILDRSPLRGKYEKLVSAHYLPVPRVSEGEWLAGQAGVAAMMDISDGVASDLRHMLERSGGSAAIETTRLPLSSQTMAMAAETGMDLVQTALAGGEDYELLLTLRPEAAEEIARRFEARFGLPLTIIGEIVPGGGDIRYLEKGNPIDSQRLKGFSHFG